MIGRATDVAIAPPVADGASYTAWLGVAVNATGMPANVPSTSPRPTSLPLSAVRRRSILGVNGGSESPRTRTYSLHTVRNN